MDKELKQQLNNIRKDIKSDLASFKEDIKDVKSNVASNKESIKEMKGDLKAAKEERADLKSDVGVNKANIQEGFEEVGKELTDLKERINKTYDSVDGFTKTVDNLEQEFTFLKKDVNKIKEVVKEELGVDLF